MEDEERKVIIGLALRGLACQDELKVRYKGKVHQLN